MKKNQNHDDKIKQLLKDKDFSSRTAAAVVGRAGQLNQGPRVRSFLAVAAALLLFASVFWYANRQSDEKRYAGLTAASAELIVSQTETSWDDTDSVIDDSLALQ